MVRVPHSHEHVLVARKLYRHGILLQCSAQCVTPTHSTSTAHSSTADPRHAPKRAFLPAYPPHASLCLSLTLSTPLRVAASEHQPHPTPTPSPPPARHSCHMIFTILFALGAAKHRGIAAARGSDATKTSGSSFDGDLTALVHRQSQVDALFATRMCPVVVYTSVESAIMPKLGPSPTNDNVCYVALLGEQSSQAAQKSPEKLAGWTPIRLRRTPQSEGMSNRRFSRIGKLLPHIFFGNATTTIFTDSKVHLRMNPIGLAHLVNGGTRFAAFRHPSLNPRVTPYEWMRREAALVAENRRVENITVMEMQLLRYEQDASVPPAAYTDYIDGALLIQRGAVRLFNAWAREYFGANSCDRDQISFAHIFATLTTRGLWAASDGCFLAPAKPECKAQTRCHGLGPGLCHWYYGNSVATLHRTSYEHARGIRLGKARGQGR